MDTMEGEMMVMIVKLYSENRNKMCRYSFSDAFTDSNDDEDEAKAI